MSPFLKRFTGDLNSDLMEPIQQVFPKSIDWESFGLEREDNDPKVGNEDDNSDHKEDDDDSTPIDSETIAREKQEIYLHLVNQCMETINKDEAHLDVAGEGDMETKKALMLNEKGKSIDVNSVGVDSLAAGVGEESDFNIYRAFAALMEFGINGNLQNVPGKVCALLNQLTMKEREVGSVSVQTKAMSLTCRYILKQDDDTTAAAVNRDNIQRDSIVIIFDEEKHRELHYRVLGVFKKYYNKWFHPKPNEDSTPFSTGKPPSIRLSLRMMTHKRVGTATMHQAEEMYTAVET